MARAEQQERLKPRRSAKSSIPRFKSVEEAAEFWDTHSLADFEAELEPVEDVQFVVRRGRPGKALTVRLDEESLEAMRQQAGDLGIAPATLARMWILERLKAQRKGPQQS